MRLDDRILALLFAALGATMIALTANFPEFPGQRYGPALFPRILGGLMIGASAILLLRASRVGGVRGVRFDPFMSDPARMTSFLLVPGAVVFYLLAAEPLGFIPTAFAMTLVMMLWFRVPVLRALVVAVAATALVNWFFGTLMRVPLPRGLFMQIVAGG
ncbi:MAG: tripartite tricarboxylate transporter TctB family protein [Rhizobiales bacterium]|nr:tripartite tricarboxylate transporter TctB family protein [Hyphomicrobiales bacterium]